MDRIEENDSVNNNFDLEENQAILLLYREEVVEKRLKQNIALPHELQEVKKGIDLLTELGLEPPGNVREKILSQAREQISEKTDPITFIRDFLNRRKTGFSLGFALSVLLFLVGMVFFVLHWSHPGWKKNDIPLTCWDIIQEYDCDIDQNIRSLRSVLGPEAITPVNYYDVCDFYITSFYDDDFRYSPYNGTRSYRRMELLLKQADSIIQEDRDNL